MPSYSYLFRPGDVRGEALVMYLSSLGADTIAERYTTRASWSPASGSQPLSGERGEVLFKANCVVCHGATGAGDGQMAKQLEPREPRNLRKGEWQFFPRTLPAPQRLREIARIIKFGIPTTSMPGHEPMSDKDVLALSSYVLSLQIPPEAP